MYSSLSDDSAKTPTVTRRQFVQIGAVEPACSWVRAPVGPASLAAVAASQTENQYR